jgi:hypothetical protein
VTGASLAADATGYGKNTRNAPELTLEGADEDDEDDGVGDGDEDDDASVTSTSTQRLSPPSSSSQVLGQVGLSPPVK